MSDYTRLPHKYAKAAGYKCAVCKAEYRQILNKWNHKYTYVGRRASDMRTGERWCFCSTQCKDMWLLNPLGYPASFISKNMSK